MDGCLLCAANPQQASLLSVAVCPLVAPVRLVRLGHSLRCACVVVGKGQQLARRYLAQAYKAHYGAEWAERFCEQASLLWIRRTNQAPINDWMAYLPVGPQLKAAGEKQIARVQALLDEAGRINACQSD